jgi:hypothetical protein
MPLPTSQPVNTIPPSQPQQVMSFQGTSSYCNLSYSLAPFQTPVQNNIVTHIQPSADQSMQLMQQDLSSDIFSDENFFSIDGISDTDLINTLDASPFDATSPHFLDDKSSFQPSFATLQPNVITATTTTTSTPQNANVNINAPFALSKITDFSPEWDYTDGGAKVLITSPSFKVG